MCEITICNQDGQELMKNVSRFEFENGKLVASTIFGDAKKFNSIKKMKWSEVDEKLVITFS